MIAANAFKIDTNAFNGNYLMIFCQTFGVFYYYSNFVFIGLFLFIISEVRVRFTKINEILELQNIFDIKFSNQQVTLYKPNFNNTSKYIQHLKHTSQLHLDVNSTISLINQIFSIPIMIQTGFCITSGVISLYELFSIFSIPNVTMQQIGFCLIVNAWLPNSLISIILEITSCMLAISERNKMKKILRNFLSKENDEKVQRRLRIFQQQIIHSDASFNCGLFEFHWSFLGTVS
ncbi:hypothetical protein ACKWTF_016289 [Chironomus riparius]